MQLYEVIYEQRLDNDITRRTQYDHCGTVHINLRNYTNVYAAEDLSSLQHAENSTESSPLHEGIRLTLKHVLSQSVQSKDYDIVFCGTGYDRTSWINLLIFSDIGKQYGLHGSSAPIELETSAEMDRQLNPTFEMVDHTRDRRSSATNSSTSTSSPSDCFSHSTHDRTATKLFISRDYRLLPASTEEADAGIYLQGCAETTHGISESLLSILGVRAGLVVDAIYDRVQGTF